MAPKDDVGVDLLILDDFCLDSMDAQESRDGPGGECF